MKDVVSFMLLGICTGSLIACFVLIHRMLQALSKKEPDSVNKMCRIFLFCIICGGLSLSSYVVLDTLAKTPSVTIGLILLKIWGAIGPFAIGGGCAIYLFRKAAGKNK